MSGRLARWRWMFPALVVVVLTVVPSPARGQSDDDASPEPSDVADELVIGAQLASGTATVAEPPRSPTDVAIRIDVRQILAIDERNSRFEVDAVLTAQWIDKRGLDDCTTRRVHHGESAADMLKTAIWAPAFTVVDGRGSRRTTALEVSVSCDGNVRYEERFAVAVTQRFTNLNDFPFDSHIIRFQVAPFGRAGQEAVRFEALAGDENSETEVAQKAADKFEAEEWNIASPTQQVVTSPPSVITSIQIDRETFYYWINIIAPLALIVSISWIAFWMKPVLHERLGIAITVLLTVVAFDFLTSDSLPKLSFTTRIDQFYNVSYLFVALTIAATFFATRRGRDVPLDRVSDGDDDGEHDDGEHEDAEHDDAEQDEVGTIDQLARYAFPPSYALAVVLVVGYGFASPGRSEVPDPAMVDVAAAADTTNLTELTDDDPIGGTIDAAGQSDSYRVCGSRDEVVSVLMERAPVDDDESLDPVLSLFALGDQTENRELVSSDDDGAGGLDSLLVLPQAEECYVLVAGDLTGEGVGTYVLTLGRGDASAVGVDVAGEFEDVTAAFGVSFDELVARQTEVASGGQVSGSIDMPGEVRSYRVCSQGDPGGFVVMESVGDVIGAEFDPFLVLYDEAGTFVASDDDGAAGLDSQLVLPPGGDCFVLVAGDVSSQVTGKYTLRLEPGEPPVVDDSQAADFEDVELLFGQSFEQLSRDAVDLGRDGSLRASIEQAGQVRPYRVCSQGDPGGFVLMERVGDATENGFDPFLLLYAEDGSYVTLDDDGTEDLDSLLALPTGEQCFVLIAGDVTSRATGDFTLETFTDR